MKVRAAAAYVAMVAAAIVLFLVIRDAGEALVAPPPAAAHAPLGAAGPPAADALFHVLLALATVVVAGRLVIGRLFAAIGQPPVIGEVVAGILLGPSLLGRIAPDAAAYILPASAAPFLGVIAQLGVILYMFLVGLELNADVLRRRAHATIATSHASIVTPFVMGSALALFLYPRLSTSDVPFTSFALFMGIAMSITAFPVLARILTDRGIAKTELGVVALACAAADDVTAWCLLAFVVGVVHATMSGALAVAALTLGFIAIMFLAVRPLVTRLVAAHGDRPPAPRAIAIVLVGVLASALATEWIGVHAIFGAFLFGATIPHDSAVARAMTARLEDLVTVLLLPAFFAFTGMRTEIGLVSGAAAWVMCAIIIAVATVGKFGGATVAARLTGMDWAHAASLGVLMNTRGLMELIVLNIGLDLGVISPALFTMMVLMAIATTMATTPILEALRRFVARAETVRVVAVVVLIACVAPTVRAQTTATLTGVVQDSSGAVLPGVHVSVRETETAFTRSTVSGPDGRFVFAVLPVGRYELRAELAGFRPQVRTDLAVTIGETAALTVTLEIGGVEQTVTVIGGAARVNVATPELSYLVGQQAIESLPLNGRNYTDLALLQPGTLPYPSRDGGSVVAHGLGMSINGQDYRSNVYLLDGTLQNDITNGPAGSAAGTTLGTETIREFRVESSAYGAEFGRNYGGQITVLTRSGTNAARGSLFEFHRNDALDARNFFDTGDKPAFTRNQFGGTLGGPIRKDRLFYFAGYEGLRESLGKTITSFVLDDNARGGLLPDGPVAIDPAVRPYLDAIPAANGPSIGSGLAPYRFQFDQGLDEDFLQGRIDYNPGVRHQLFARYTFDDTSQRLPTDYPQFPRTFLSRNQYFTGEYRHVWSDRTLQTFRLGFSRTRIGQNVEANLTAPLPPFVAGRGLVGDIDIGGMQRFGPQSSANLRLAQNVFSGQYDVTHTRGRHLIKAGALAERYQDNMVNPTFSLGIYTFAGPRAFLENRPLRFVGLPPQGAIDRYWRFTLVGLYAQDTVQVHRRLSATAGLRYEFTTMPVDIYGRDSALPDLSDPAPTVGPLYRNPTYTNLSPRIGVAWDVLGDGTTSVRGGYGLYFNTNNQQNLIVTVTNPPATPRFVIANPTFPSPPFERGVGNSIRPVQYDLDNPRLHMWNVNVQRSLPLEILATVGYAGARGRHLLRSGDVNVPAPTAGADGRLVFPPAGTPRPNRAFSTIELKSSDGESWYKALVFELRRRWQHGFSAQSSYTWSKTTDTTQASTFFSDATNGTTSAFPEFEPDYNKGPADWDTPHNWVFNVVWDVPRAKGSSRVAEALLAGWQIAAIGNVRSGQPLTVFVQNNRSRSQWSPSLAPGVGLDRADLAPGRTPGSAVLGQPDQWFDPAAFRLQPAGTLGNSGRGAFRGPNLRTIDLAAVKTAPLRRGARLEIRLEVFNVFNRANFGNPTLIAFTGSADNEAPQASFGRIRSTVTSARQVQLGVRLAF